MSLQSASHPPNIDQITKRFYERFKNVRAHFLADLHGIPTVAESERYASLILNRLMFLYFIQQKSFLADDTHYLSNRLRMIQDQPGQNCFYRSFLLPLFHEGLGMPEHSPSLQTLLGDVPYLGGDLFKQHEIEQNNPGIQIPDESFTKLFAFFDSYCWHLDEGSLRYENEITPGILGYIFEKYINQQQMGAYYTKEDVTEYIAKSTLIPTLFDKLDRLNPAVYGQAGTIWQFPQISPDRYIHSSLRDKAYLPIETAREYRDRQARYNELRARITTGTIRTIDDFITHNLDICRFAQDVIQSSEEPATIFEQLQQMTVLDPTCGSGAFLFAALNILEPLYQACLKRMLPEQHTRSAHRYLILKTIITHNLYGVDIMEEAAEICKLRLFLKLIAQIEHVEDIVPLPDIDHNIRSGNALVGFIASNDCATLANDALPSHTELDHALARTYDVDPDDANAFAAWHAQHQPFHWCIEFSPILKKGGFNVILGNPPYVEYGYKSFPYRLRDFTTLSCANLYTCVVERCYALLSPDGRQGMILPLAAFATKNMIPLIEGFRRWFPCSWLSFYHFRPSMLFSGGKIASIPMVIYLAKTEGDEQRFSTGVLKWFTEQRNLLFPLLSYCPITAPPDPDNRHYYPKFSNPLENTILEKVLRQNKVSTYLTQAPGTNTMYYRSAGGLYWKVFINFPWPYATTSNKQCTFQEQYERDIFVALFNSSLFWWYYTVTFDTFNLKDYMLFGFRFTYPEDTTITVALKTLCASLMENFRLHAKHLKRGNTGSYTVYAKKARDILDSIDTLLAQHYDFSNEELDFLLSYDSKYRMGMRGAEGNEHAS